MKDHLAAFEIYPPEDTESHTPIFSISILAHHSIETPPCENCILSNNKCTGITNPLIPASFRGTWEDFNRGNCCEYLQPQINNN